ncbi:MAG: hypothetical protein ACI84C_000315 [Flavobacteriales bacterium]|jgi:hypothetical protein
MTILSNPKKMKILFGISLNVLLMLIAIVPNQLHGQYAVEWGDEIAVSVEGTDNNRPRIALDGNNDPLVIWGQDDGKMLHFARWENVNFAPSIELVSPEFDVFTAEWSGPELAARGNDVYATFKRVTNVEVGTYIVKSNDGGVTWSDTIRVDAELPEDMHSRFPNVAIDDNGNPAITLMTFTGNYIDPGYEVLSSIDGGMTFGPIQNSSTELFDGEACDCCTSDLLFAEGKLIQLFRNNDGNIREIKCAYSTDWGQSFPNSFGVDNTDTFANFCFSSGPDGLVMDGVLYSAFKAIVPDGNRIWISAYDLENESLVFHEAPDLFIANNLSQNNSKIAGGDANMGVVWEEYSSINSNVIFSYSFEGPEGFQEYKDTINVQMTGRQVNPDIAYADGFFHAVWQDKSTGLVSYRKGEVVKAVNVENVLKSSIEVFPNPTTDVLNIRGLTSSVSKIYVLDQNGKQQLVLTNFSSDELELDVQKLIPGIYSLVIESIHQKETYSIVKL